MADIEIQLLRACRNSVTPPTPLDMTSTMLQAFVAAVPPSGGMLMPGGLEELFLRPDVTWCGYPKVLCLPKYERTGSFH